MAILVVVVGRAPACRQEDPGTILQQGEVAPPHLPAPEDYQPQVSGT